MQCRRGFHAGAFDVQEFLVIDDGTNVTFKLKQRDLSRPSAAHLRKA